MEKFVPKFQRSPWPDGARVLHVYAVPNLQVDHQLARLVGECRKAMLPFPITPIGDGTLHCTLEMVADTTADKITAEERGALLGALRKHLADAGPLEITAGSPVANRVGAFLDLSPDDGLLDLRERVRAAIREVRGPGALLHDGGRPHISLGYSWATASSDELQTALRRISPSHAPVHVSGVQLLDVQFRQHSRPNGQTAWELSWELVAELPLDNAV
ncbi:2'-5' RNA ligase family protein [Streptomyces sp. CBMA123]|uniref:2'-5' RNA ligase family protein n=1 Tax=Streptomyces sp. CBMA123 TaxID=1896313 RepID=UPI001661D42C|nr:2'-5' RNA ligase family protein [Streptomyces sp. CBMA123]